MRKRTRSELEQAIREGDAYREAFWALMRGEKPIALSSGELDHEGEPETYKDGSPAGARVWVLVPSAPAVASYSSTRAVPRSVGRLNGRATCNTWHRSTPTSPRSAARSSDCAPMRSRKGLRGRPVRPRRTGRLVKKASTHMRRLTKRLWRGLGANQKFKENTVENMNETYEIGQAIVCWGQAVAETLRRSDTSAIDALCSGHDVSDKRRESLSIALGLGADEVTLIRLRDANRVARGLRIVLPQGRYEHCSRGKGWARRGKGASVAWGERVDSGYRVETEGRWIVGSNDGFSRKEETAWDVERIAVGSAIWTVAS